MKTTQTPIPFSELIAQDKLVLIYFIILMSTTINIQIKYGLQYSTYIRK